MLDLTLQHTLNLFSAWGYAFILPLSILEGPIVSVIAGFLSSLGTFNWFVVFLVLLLGDVVGDALYYALGRWGHGPVVRRIASYIGLTAEREEKLAAAFHVHDSKVLVLNKLQAIGSVVLYFAGAVRMDFWRFILINTLASIPKVAFFELIGFYFGESYNKINHYLDYAGIASLLIPILLLGGYVLVREYLRRKGSADMV